MIDAADNLEEIDSILKTSMNKGSLLGQDAYCPRTLTSFSLEKKVGIVTGGARGLGLAMAQAMVNSGADVAIVDLNSRS